ncbi:MAG: hypothetical protein JW953_22880 [Anaerolineae bacterium]|nr:hypothetical protein [Anaerolineae bacterium]
MKSSQGIPAQVQIIQVSDQESDIYEYFVHPWPEHIELLVRVHHCREVATKQREVRATLTASPVRSKIVVEVRAAKERPARMVTCQVYYKPVKLRPPRPRPGLSLDLKPVNLYAILIREMNPLKGVEVLEWLLLTTLAVSHFLLTTTASVSVV